MVDYFDDEFLEKIPSIAPDLMFVEESANQQQTPKKSQPREIEKSTTEKIEKERREKGKIEKEKSTQEQLNKLQIKEESIQEKLQNIESDQDLEILLEQDEEIIVDIDTDDLPSTKLENSFNTEKDVKVEEETQENVQEMPDPMFTLTSKDKENLLNFIIDDHSYARPFSLSKDENENIGIATASILKLVPINKTKGKKTTKNDGDIDIMSVDKPESPLVKYDSSRGRHVMNEVETYLNSLWKDVEKNEEEKISRGSWSRDQAKLFDLVYSAINNYQLAKLTHHMHSNEPVLRKLALDKATKRVRKAFATALWNAKLIGWLHGIMIDGLCSSFFLCYLEILQSVKRKVPSLFERVFLHNKATLEKEQTAGLNNLGFRLKKSWEPAVGLHTKVNIEKFPSLPFIINIPSGPSVPHQSTKRNRFWNYQLLNFGKTVPISAPAYMTKEGYVVKHYLEHCISAVRTNVATFNTRFANRPIVLLGWDVGALVALKVALLDKVDAVICLGFPNETVEGDECPSYWESFGKVRCPVLFFVGTHATSNSLEKVENLRQQMKVHTSLIVMESGDELLRLTNSQKKSLGMSQNMVDKLIQDQLYLFLKENLFKVNGTFPKLKESPSPRKKKKKVATGIEAGIDLKDESKKKKKNKQLNQTVASGDASFCLSPLDVTVPGSSADVASSQMKPGLLTTGSFSTPIPVTQMQSENLMTPSSISHTTVISTEMPCPLPAALQKAGQKRSSTSGKEKAPRKKVSKKPKNMAQQNFTANLGTQRSGNLLGQRFTTPLQNKAGGIAQTATLQRLSSGTFVLSGTTGGHVKLQNGNNIVYLQQLTSSGGTTQVIQTPLIANSNGTFSTVSLANCSIQPNIVTTASTSTATTANTASATAFGLVQSTVDTSSKTNKPPNLTTTNTLLQRSPNESKTQTPLSSPSVSSKLSSPMSLAEEGIIQKSETVSQEIETSTEDPLVPNLPSHLANLILSLPTTMGADSADATAKAQSILQKLSEEDIKTLATVLAKSTPNSPVPSPGLTPEHGRSPLQSPGVSTPSTPSPLFEQSSTITTQPSTIENKSTLISLLDSKSLISTTPSPTAVAGSSKINTTIKRMNTHSLSLTQKVSAMQQEMNKIRTPRLKPPRIITSLSSSKLNSPTTSTSTITGKSLHSKTQKVPITITIPISRLPSSLQLTTSNSKTINVPALSAYLAQQKFVLSTGKSNSNLDSRTVLLSPSNVKRIAGGIMVSTNSTKGSSVFNAKGQQKELAAHSTGKSPATITLHLPTQSSSGSSKEISTLKKAASDIKLIGVLNQKTKAAQLVNISSIKPSSLPSSPTARSSSPNTSDMSPIQPRAMEEEGTKDSEVIDESDIDFNVIPTGVSKKFSGNPQPPQTSSSYTAFPTTTIATIPLSTSSKIIRVPVSSGDRRFFAGKNLLELSKSKLSESQLMNSARKVGVAFQQVKSAAETRHLDAASTGALDSNKLRFEPLHLPTSRTSRPPTATLGSLSESGKILLEEHARSTILAKPTVVSSKTAAMIARTAFMSDTKLSAKPAGISFSSLNKNLITTKPTTPALFSGGNKTTAHVLSTPAATIRTATTSKVLPVTIKSNDFIRMSSQVRAVQPNQTKTIPAKIIKKEITTKIEMKPKAPKKPVEVKIPKEEPPKEEPPPYITRSGRVLRTRVPYADELDRKPSPRKRRRTSSTSKDEGQPPSPVPTPPAMGNIGSSLDSLLEAAKLITTGDTVLQNPPEVATPTATHLSHIDSTTNMAATAMLELLASNATVLPQVPLQVENSQLSIVDTACSTEESLPSIATETQQPQIPGEILQQQSIDQLFQQQIIHQAPEIQIPLTEQTVSNVADPIPATEDVILEPDVQPTRLDTETISEISTEPITEMIITPSITAQHIQVMEEPVAEIASSNVETSILNTPISDCSTPSTAQAVVGNLSQMEEAIKTSEPNNVDKNAEAENTHQPLIQEE
ncbi:uncharacterized protein [Clytia hemisphaerica]|uniref:KAT8 regulatory NSL complex subunit 3 n=1 Tax=Clytia hemisphaerica TaxID=252671 RepID=A0A7M5XHG5_9CNID